MIDVMLRLLALGDPPLERRELAAVVAHLQRDPDGRAVVARTRIGPELLLAAAGELRLADAVDDARRRAWRDAGDEPGVRAALAETGRAVGAVEEALHAAPPAKRRMAMAARAGWGLATLRADTGPGADAARLSLREAWSPRWDARVQALGVGPAWRGVHEALAALDLATRGRLRPDTGLWLEAELGCRDACGRLLRALAASHHRASPSEAAALDRALAPLWRAMAAHRHRLPELDDPPVTSAPWGPWSVEAAWQGTG